MGLKIQPKTIQDLEGKEEETCTCAVGEGELRVSEKEAMAQTTASIVAAKVSKALALYPNECIFQFASLFFVSQSPFHPITLCSLEFYKFTEKRKRERERKKQTMAPRETSKGNAVFGQRGEKEIEIVVA